MLITRNETSTQDALKRISIVRGTTEPDKEPTEKPETVVVSTEALEETKVEIEEVETKVDPIESVPKEVVEEPEVNDDDDLYVEYKGREINLKDVEQWEQGNLRQSDYTKKTQELAEQRKAVEATQQEHNDKLSKLNEHVAVLEAIIAEETLPEDKLAELREFEPEDYIKYTEKLNARSKALETAKVSQPISKVNTDTERQKLWNANPKWLDNGKSTQAYNDDMKLIDSYTKANNYTQEEIQGITNANHWQTLIEAAKYRELVNKSSVIAKKVRKAPVTTKPREVSQTTLQTKLKDAQARLKQTGRSDDAITVRRLKREIAKE